MSAESLLLFALAGILLNLTPGPDVLFIVSHALRGGVRAGVVAALGITGGCFVHIVAATVGVSAVIAASSTAFTVLKWLGAAYLVYVGARLLLSRQAGQLDIPEAAAEASAQTAAPQTESATASLWRVFWSGFATNALNPKVALFFLAFLPQFIGPQVQDPRLAFLGLGLLFNFNALWVDIGWAVLAAWLARRASVVRRGLGLLDRVAGAMFVGFGLKLALSDNPVH